MPGRTSARGRIRGAGPRGTGARALAGAAEGGAPGPAGAGKLGPTGGGALGDAIAARATPDRTVTAPLATRVAATQIASRWVIREPTGEPLENPDKGAVRVTRARRGGLSRD